MDGIHQENLDADDALENYTMAPSARYVQGHDPRDPATHDVPEECKPGHLRPAPGRPQPPPSYPTQRHTVYHHVEAKGQEKTEAAARPAGAAEVAEVPRVVSPTHFGAKQVETGNLPEGSRPVTRGRVVLPPGIGSSDGYSCTVHTHSSTQIK